MIFAFIYLFGFFTKIKRTESQAVVSSAPGISIIIASRNALPLLEKNLPNWLAQDYPNFEVIIANDRSTDEHAWCEVCDLRRALGVVFWCVDMAASVKAHMNAAHDLLAAFRRIVFLQDLHFELHVLLEAEWRAHGELGVLKRQADVHDFSDCNCHVDFLC
jgi:cellulose synthase/poly-beta-1,6-N-acetylglucosamine synthase-like glycosyltransferase